VEARFKVLSNDFGADDGFAATFWVESDLGQSRFRLGTDQLHIGDLYDPVDGFSTLRVECGVPGVSGCATPDVILDGTNLGSIGFNSGITGSKVTFGNHSGSAQAEVVWDYFVINQEIPKPSSVVLLAIGILTLVIRRRRA